MEKQIFKGTTALAILLLISFAPAGGAQLEKTFTWKYPAGNETRILIDNYNCDLVVHVWEKSETEYHLTIAATGKTADDETRLQKYLESYSFKPSASTVSFHNAFWKNRRTINGKTTLEIDGGKNIELTDFNMKAELWMPAANALELGSKYSRIDLDNLNGKLRLDLYNDNVFGSNISGIAEINAKYTNLEFREMKELKGDLYNCDFEATATANLQMVSKYSKFSCTSSGNIDLDSYNDKYSFDKTGDINFRAKYSDLKTSLSGKADLDCYNGTIIIKDGKDIKLSSKYADFRTDVAGTWQIVSSYNDKFSLGKINNLQIGESKYSNYKIEELSGPLTETDGYNDNFIVSKAGGGFKEIRLAGKYLELSLGIPVTVDFRLKANIRYPTLEINESAFKTKTKIVENSGMQFDGVRGNEKEGMPLIELSGYEVTLKIIDIK